VQGQISRRLDELLRVEQPRRSVRKGTANAFCIVEPKTGKRLTRATRRRANRDFARALARISKAYRKANGSISCSTT
jgi:hypothetical protein